MANTSILIAFERMWHHVLALLANKANVSDLDDTNNAVAQKAQVQIITWEADD